MKQFAFALISLMSSSAFCAPGNYLDVKGLYAQGIKVTPDEIRGMNIFKCFSSKTPNLAEFEGIHTYESKPHDRTENTFTAQDGSFLRVEPISLDFSEDDFNNPHYKKSYSNLVKVKKTIDGTKRKTLDLGIPLWIDSDGYAILTIVSYEQPNSAPTLIRVKKFATKNEAYLVMKKNIRRNSKNRAVLSDQEDRRFDTDYCYSNLEHLR